MSSKRKANRLSYLKFAITNSYRMKKQKARAEAERKRRLEIKSAVSAQTFFGPPAPQKLPSVEEVKSPESQKAKVLENSSPVRQNSENETSKVFKTPPRPQRLEQLRNVIPMTSPGEGSPETKRKSCLRKNEILAELERNDNPQSPPMKVFQQLRSERLKQKRSIIISKKLICDNPKMLTGDDFQESIMTKQKEELTRNDNPQSPPIKRFSQLRTERILKSATKQPDLDQATTMDSKNTVTRQKAKLKLFGMPSDNSAVKSSNSTVIPIDKSAGKKPILESENNNIVDKKEESGTEEISMGNGNKSKSSNVSIFRESQNQSTHDVPSSQNNLPGHSPQTIDANPSNDETLINCPNGNQEPIQSLAAKSEKSEPEKGRFKRIDNYDCSELKKVAKENSRKSVKISKSKVTTQQRENEQTILSPVSKTGTESKPESGKQISMTGLSLDRVEEDQTTRLRNFHRLETSLMETDQAEAEVTSPGSAQLNQYPSSSDLTTENKLLEQTLDPVIVSSKCKLQSLPVFNKCFIPLVQVDKISAFETKRKEENMEPSAVTFKTHQVKEKDVQVNVVSSGPRVKSFQDFGIRIKPLDYQDLNRLPIQSKLKLFANKPVIRLTNLNLEPERPRKSVKRSLSIELSFGEEDAPKQLSKKPKLMKNDLKLK